MKGGIDIMSSVHYSRQTLEMQYGMGCGAVVKIDTDILVVGGGAAGCFAAIKAREAGARNIILVDKGYVGKSGCTKFAAGSFKCFIPDLDDYDLWMTKAVEEGCYINDQDWTRKHLEDVYSRALELDAWGVPFLKDDAGRFDRLEGQGSSHQRPIKTMMFEGPVLMDILRKVVKQRSVKIIDKTMVTHLIHDRSDAHTIAGALGFDLKTGEQCCFTAKAVILTAGAQAFKSHYAYQKMVTGDAHVMGLRAGAELTNYEFCCHHLACADLDTTGMNVLQGVGARFLNRHGEPYMLKYDPEYGDHAAMNRLSAAMACEVRKGNGPIFLDFSRFSSETLAYFKKTLPIMYLAFEKAGIIQGEAIQDRVEWVSVNMGNVGYGGGLKINTECETSLNGLYAAGDATCGPASGVEGFCAYAIPFASTSGAIAGRSAAKYARTAGAIALNETERRRFSGELAQPLKRSQGVEPDTVVLRVQELIFPMDVYILRHQSRLEKTLNEMVELRRWVAAHLKAYDPHYLRMAIEAVNMVTCGELFLRAALKRTESRGSHLREDFLDTDNIDWIKWIILAAKGDETAVSTEDIPIDRYPVQPEKKRIRHPVAGMMAADPNNANGGKHGG